MEEAELLCDEIVLQAHGAFQATGSPSELKQKFGGGYVAKVKFNTFSNEFVSKVFAQRWGIDLDRFCNDIVMSGQKDGRTGAYLPHFMPNMQHMQSSPQAVNPLAQKGGASGPLSMLDAQRHNFTVNKYGNMEAVHYQNMVILHYIYNREL